MRYGQIRKYDVANGPGIRSTIFVTGCTHNCKNCFNKEYQDFDYGDVWTSKETKEVIDYLKLNEVNGLTVLGGEPFQNEKDLYKIIKEIQKEISKDIWIFSGYTFDQIIEDENKKKLLELCDVLVDGPFIEDLKNLKLKFRGSSNQRIIDIKKSFKENQVIELDI